MVNPTPAPDSSAQDKPRAAPPSTPRSCFIGALISSGFAVALYLLTRSIMEVFAGIPLPTKSNFAVNISVAVRTLVIGTSVLGTAIFSIAALGLVALGIQLLLKQLRQAPEDK